MVAGMTVWLALQSGHQNSSQQVCPWHPDRQSRSVRQVRANANPLVSIPEWADADHVGTCASGINKWAVHANVLCIQSS